MNQVMYAIKDRRSVRSFKKDRVGKELLKQVVDAGLWAASSMDRQSPIIVAITDPEVLKKLSAVNSEIGGWEKDYDPFYGAPCVIVVLGDASIAPSIYDGSLALGNMMLAAESLGLGSCWIHRAKETFERPEWKEWLKEIGVQGDYIGIGQLSIGYTEGPKPKAHEIKPNRAYYVDEGELVSNVFCE